MAGWKQSEPKGALQRKMLGKSLFQFVYVDHARRSAYSTYHLRQVLNPGRRQNLHRPVYLPMWLQPSPVFYFGGIIFYILEKHDSFVRFYAMQSIIFGCAWFLFLTLCRQSSMPCRGAIPGIGGILVFFWAIIAALVGPCFW